MDPEKGTCPWHPPRSTNVLARAELHWECSSSPTDASNFQIFPEKDKVNTQLLWDTEKNSDIVRLIVLNLVLPFFLQMGKPRLKAEVHGSMHLHKEMF